MFAGGEQGEGTTTRGLKSAEQNLVFDYCFAEILHADGTLFSTASESEATFLVSLFDNAVSSIVTVNLYARNV